MTKTIVSGMLLVAVLVSLGCGGHAPFSPLIGAARRGDVAALKSMLQAGDDPNLRDPNVNGWTPLIHAIHVGQNQTALALLEAGADPNARGKGGTTPLMMAAGNGNTEMVRALLARGADPHVVLRGGMSAFTLAVSGGALSDIDRPLLGRCYPDTVKALLEKDSDLKVELENNFAGSMAHFFAWFNNCSEVLEELLYR